MRLAAPVVWMTLALSAIFAGLPFLWGGVGMRETLFLAAIAIILASNLNLMIGFTGYVNFGSIVFFGLGGYFGVWLTTVQGWNLMLSAIAAGLLVSAFALVFGLGILRLRGAYFALATIGINEAVQAFVANFAPWGGATGLYLDVSAYQPLGGPRQALWTVYFLVIGVMAASLIVAWLIKSSRLGLALFAIREDEDAASVLGVDPARFKAVIYSASGFLPATAGALYFFKNGVISPDQAFDLTTSTEIIVMLMLGGQGTITGAALGAFVYQQFRFTLLTSPLFADFQLMIAGALLLVIVLFAPGGLIGWTVARWPRLRRVLQ
jgi:branched-chain amino acid transport system permease protein